MLTGYSKNDKNVKMNKYKQLPQENIKEEKYEEDIGDKDNDNKCKI